VKIEVNAKMQCHFYSVWQELRQPTTPLPLLHNNFPLRKVSLAVIITGKWEENCWQYVAKIRKSKHYLNVMFS
jgi:hypothetical protein